MSVWLIVLIVILGIGVCIGIFFWYISRALGPGWVSSATNYIHSRGGSIGGLDSSKPEDRERILELITGSSNIIVDRIKLAALGDPDPGVRKASIHSLLFHSGYYSPEFDLVIEKALLRATRDKDLSVRIYAIESLNPTMTLDAYSRLFELLRSRDIMMKRAAAKHIGWMYSESPSQWTPGFEETTELLASHLNDPDLPTRKYCAMALLTVAKVYLLPHRSTRKACSVLRKLPQDAFESEEERLEAEKLVLYFS